MTELVSMRVPATDYLMARVEVDRLRRIIRRAATIIVAEAFIIAALWVHLAVSP
jgi:hypothetical protein